MTLGTTRDVGSRPLNTVIKGLFYGDKAVNIKKSDILDAATKLFSKNGYNAVGVDAIVTASGVAKMTFYKHFPSKEYLIERVLEKRDKDLQASILEAMEARRTPKTKIKALFDWYEAWFNGNDYYGCMFIKAADEFPTIGGKVKEISQYHKAWLVNLLAELLKEHGVKGHGDLAISVMVLLDGLTVRTNTFDTNVKTLMAATWRQVETLIKADMA